MTRYAVQLTPDAIEYLSKIVSWIAWDSPAYAKAVHERLRRAVAELSTMPRRYEFAREAASGDKDAKELRQAVVGPYRIVFTIEENVVTVFAIVHAHRDKWQGPRRT